VTKRQLLPVVALLLMHFFIRSHHITGFYAYIDEGFHVQRGAVIWDFDMNPGRFAHGKLLLYFWLGLFESKPTDALLMSRLSIAVVSMLTAATIYLIGRLLGSHKIALLALGLYSVLPLAWFFERMALADPFAAVFATVTAWRSYVFARRPSMWQGVVLGFLLAGVTLAKLSMGLVPMLPFFAAVIYYRWQSGLRRFVRQVVPPLILAWAMTGAAWLPIVIPAYLARDSENSFTVVESDNAGGTGGWLRSPLPFLKQSFVESSDFTRDEFLIVAGLALLAGLLLRDGNRRHRLFLLTWFALSIALTILAAGWISSRYLMPSAGAGLLLMVFSIITVTERLAWGGLLRAGMLALAAAWVILFVIPFFRNAINEPQRLPLAGLNEIEYLGGSLIADEPDWQMGEAINALSPPPERIYGNWSVCRNVYFFTDYPLSCLDRSGARLELARLLDVQMPDCGTSYVILSGFGWELMAIQGLSGERVEEFPHLRMARTVQLWRVWWTDC
jgi:hypothetical protein